MMDGSTVPFTRTTCPYCGVGCGVLARANGAGGMEVRGDPDHPANFGRLCSKGSALGETVGLQGRLLTPHIEGAEASWDAALDLVAKRFSDTIAEHGPDSVAFYVSGQLLTEDYYVANKLMKGFIGSANIDTNSRLCMASSVAGHRRAFGSDTVPGLYEDIDLADLVVLTGSNLAWCHPVLYQRLVTAKEARPSMKVVVIDPRRTATCDIADLHLAIAPGADAALFNALLVAIADGGAVDPAYLAHVDGFDAALAAARASDPAMTGLTARDLQAFCDLWVATEKVVTVYSQGINQSSSGTDKVNAILNCHLATGRIGRPGMGPFSVTGQPNAMGGREVGGMANMLACHLSIEDPSHRAAVQGFWASPTMGEKQGLKAVDMFRAVEDGRIKALWIVCTNPAVTMPDADRVVRAIANCDFVVVSDMMADTDTTRLGDVLLPATGWGEKDGTVTNSERRISRQRSLRAASGQARDDWRIFADVAARMGWGEAFGWETAAEVFDEYAALSGAAGLLGGDFDISNRAGRADGYDTMEPFLWPDGPAKQGGRFFAEGRFHTPTGKAQMLPICPRTPQNACSPDYPFLLNTGRVRDHWHTMTRTGLSPRLSQHLAEPFLELHPDAAAGLGLTAATLAEVTSPQGKAILRVLITDRVREGACFAPMHWSGTTAPTGRIDALIASVVDPVSGQPESKATPVNIVPFDPSWYGFAVSADDFLPDCDYWARAVVIGGMRAELAGRNLPADWGIYARQIFNLPDAQILRVDDHARGITRLAFTDGGKVLAALFIASTPVAVSRQHLAGLLGAAPGIGILAGRPGADMPDPGAILCACFDVGVNVIAQAIAQQGLITVEALGSALRAGTNCGSCRPEMKALIARHIAPICAAAE
jgi:assimilatory nitrate reductase catalytic subunit